ncbi:MAG: HlyD family efflux transporter periplasmic adaptor subunit [Oscillospiraceae bacterium]|jgi:multidrug efflux pump subunit AcrA (membrane-fusion protein)|nr:HlyD family efflux transporter periplasmic adaptor subunit [Oscillospiraceae bacterium]
MKQYIKLGAITIAAIMAILTVAQLRKPKIPNVELIEIHKLKVDTTISCSGVVEGADSAELTPQTPLVFKEIHFKSGERVKKGDKIASVDKAATVALLAQLIGKYSSIEGVLSSLNLPDSGMDYSKLPIQDSILSPADGIISTWNADGSTYMNITEPLLTISNPDKLQVRLSVNESLISNIQKGQYAIISGAGFNSKYSGLVTDIASSARKELGASLSSETVVDVFVTLTDVKKDIKPGFTASTKILTNGSENVLMAPYRAVGEDEQNREFVYVYENGMAKKRIIATRREFENGFEVISGLAEGEKIIADASLIEADGTYVNIP